MGRLAFAFAGAAPLSSTKYWSNGFASQVIPEIGGAVTLSFGVTAYAKSDSPDNLLSRVDHALYQSKQSGRNQVTKSA